MEQPLSLAREFELEVQRIERSIWDALALRAGTSALFCGSANDLDVIKRTVAGGIAVSVISDDDAAITGLRAAGISVLRGSSTLIPARDESFDVAIAFHYLHEIDPLFHQAVVSELARVGKRCVIVEPAPPGDPLGLRIASLYSRAKRELGQFEEYHQIDYWRKLLAMVKPHVSYQTFNVRRTPPREALRETVSLIIATMAAEQTPEPYLMELRALAARSDAQLLPQARYVIAGATAAVGLATGERTSGSDRQVIATVPFVPVQVNVAPAITTYDDAGIEPEYPAVTPPVLAPAPTIAAAPESKPVSHVAPDAFGLATVPGAPAIQPAAVPQTAPDVSEDFGWAWEAPTKP